MYLSHDKSHYRALEDAQTTIQFLRALKSYCKQENITTAKQLIDKRKDNPSMILQTLSNTTIF